MADFCSLCGYDDINITDLYNSIIKPDVEKEISEMSEGEFISVSVGGVCEHCGIVAFGVNNKLEVWSRLYGEDELHHFANINPNSFDIEIIDDSPKYRDTQIEKENFLREIQVLEHIAYNLYISDAESKQLKPMSADDSKLEKDYDFFRESACDIYVKQNEENNEKGKD